jgi:hypothetical protein
LTHPEVAAQWHPTKNGSLTPHDIAARSGKKAWWKCSVASDHEWKAMVSSRAINGNGCPFCANRIVALSNCLMTTHPEFAAQWHPIKNGLLTPYDVTVGSVKKIWWKCSVADDHEWYASLNGRTSNENGCPYCNESRGEKMIALILSQRGYRFEREVKFDDCIHRRCLRFDFLVWLPNGKRFLIEFQGIYHYESDYRSSSMTQEERDAKFEDTQKRDQIKKQYADDNGVPLLVIPYWDIQVMESMIEDCIRDIV